MNTLLSSASSAELFVAIERIVEGTIFENTLIFSLSIIIATFIIGFLVKVFFRFLIQGLLSKSKIDLDDEIARTLERPIFSTVVFIGLTFSFFAFFSEPFLWGAILKIVITIILTHWTFAIVKLSKIIFTSLSRVTHVQIIKKETVPLFHNGSAIIIFVLAIYLILAFVWKIDMTALLASLGVAGIAIGFAAKDTLANLFSGVFILSDQPYQIGDFVVLGTGERGEITSIGIRSTRMLTREDVEITIPNSIMGNTSVINESGGPHEKTRITALVGVAYGTDIDQVREILMNIANNNEYVEADPAPRVRMRGFGPSSLDFALLTWVNEPADKGKTLDALYVAIYKALNEAGIEIPYQKQDLYIKELPEK